MTDRAGNSLNAACKLNSFSRTYVNLLESSEAREEPRVRLQGRGSFGLAFRSIFFG